MIPWNDIRDKVLAKEPKAAPFVEIVGRYWGDGKLTEDIARGLDGGGVSWAIEIRDWTSRLGPLYNLKAADRNREEARNLADRIVRYQWSYPGRQIGRAHV